MARLPVITSPAELNGEARRVAETIVDTRSSLEGPFSVWMHAPEWAERVAHLGTLVRWEGTLELRVRTLAALVTGRHFQAQYVWGIQGVTSLAPLSTQSATGIRMASRPKTGKSSTSPGNCWPRTGWTNRSPPPFWRALVPTATFS